MSVNLPQELLINILLKLPFKLLIQFRCVSKSWNSLISSPYFVSLQTQQAMISRAKNIKERELVILRVLRYSAAQNSEIFSVHVDDGHFTLLEDINGNIPRNCIIEHLWPQVFVHGNVHWTAYRKIGAEHDKVENLIIVFDIEHEVFGEMPLPDALKNEAPLRLNVTAFEQSLAVVHCHGRGPELEKFSIWVMKNYGDKESWNELYIPNPCNLGLWGTYSCKANGGALFASRNGGLHSYDPVTWHRRSRFPESLKSFYTGPYVESLALLNEGTEARVSVESETDVCECESLSSSIGGGFRAEVRTVEYIEFWMLPPAI